MFLVRAIAALWMLVSVSSWGLTYLLPSEQSRMLGSQTDYNVQKGDTMASIAEDFGVGFLALMAVNKGVDPFLPEPGLLLNIPTSLILPDAPREGIVINLAELRLYYFHSDVPLVDVFPIGIGRIGWETPEITTKVRSKHEHPTWTPTANIRKAYKAKGIELPVVVGSGPDNPLGEYALRLDYGYGTYLIHGTNRKFGVGLRVSSGCIRLFPNDISYLFDEVHVGTRVQIVNQPVKTTHEPDGKLYLEVHQPLNRSQEEVGRVVGLTMSPDDRQFVAQRGVDVDQVALNLREQAGIPRLIGYAVSQ
jgi:lipoprotein-anchoring transpeptidase ErfK/SrfK